MKVKRHQGDFREFKDKDFLEVINYQLKKVAEVEGGGRDYEGNRKPNDYWKVEIYQIRDNLKDKDWIWLEDPENQSLMFYQADTNSELVQIRKDNDPLGRARPQGPTIHQYTQNEQIKKWIKESVPKGKQKKLLKVL